MSFCGNAKGETAKSLPECKAVPRSRGLLGSAARKMQQCIFQINNYHRFNGTEFGLTIRVEDRP